LGYSPLLNGMSKYKIYRIDHYDPVWVGKRRRRLNLIFALLAILAAPLMLSLHYIVKVGIGEAALILAITLWGFYFLFYIRLKSENSDIKAIGDIEFTKTGIIKHLGDTLTETKYDSIHSVEIQRHIPALTMKESKTGYFTYILSICFKDSRKENLIVSDRPTGKWQDLSITQTIKTLKKLHFCQDINKIAKN
jgi:hypothetical protein